MFKKRDYIYFAPIVSKVLELDSINRKINVERLSSLSLIKEEKITEFISTNNIEDDVIPVSIAKKFLNEAESLTQSELQKRWIGIKYADDLVWSGHYSLDVNFIKEINRALLRKVETPGGIYKTKLNQVGSLITAHPEDVAKMMLELFVSFQGTVISEGYSAFNIIPFISEFLAIHPFEDGNGRTSRALMNRMFYEAGYKFTKYISVSKYLWDQKSRYISALESRNRAWGAKVLKPEDLIPFFEIILDALIFAANTALRLQSLRKYSYEQFASIVTKLNEFTFKDLFKLLEYANSDNSIKSYLQKLVDNNLLTQVGELKSTKYIPVKK